MLGGEGGLEADKVAKVRNAAPWQVRSLKDFLKIMRVSSLLKHQHGGDFERLQAMASPNQMHHHQSPPMPNFCGNGFGPWNHGAHPERVGFPQGPVGWQGATQSPSSYIVKKILRLEIPTVQFYWPSSWAKGKPVEED